MRRLIAALVPAFAVAAPLAAQDIGYAPADTFPARWEMAVDEFDAAPAVFAVSCPGGGSLVKSVWGTDEYTDDSGACVAAVHAGILTVNGGVAVVERRPGRSSYQGSSRHGVTSRDYGAWPRSFRFVRVAATIAARPEDVSTIDGIIAAFYEVISGPAGAPRDWARDATLYLPGIAFTVSEEPGSGPVTMAKNDWIADADPFFLQLGFHEWEIHRVTHQFGRVAHVWSTYEWRLDDGRTGRGINSIHLFHDGERWYITHATWEGERPDNPIPAEFLP